MIAKEERLSHRNPEFIAAIAVISFFFLAKGRRWQKEKDITESGIKLQKKAIGLNQIAGK